ncbi:MAG: Uncharacterised protein [Flavobacteriia bacterium]|nr:MAG: Uncharacterised protein [Flavobacteriia bacterium]
MNIHSAFHASSISLLSPNNERWASDKPIRNRAHKRPAGKSSDRPPAPFYLWLKKVSRLF